MTGQEVINIIQKYYPLLSLINRYQKGNIIQLDDVYLPVEENEIKRKWYEVWTKAIWTKESWDCDEEAMSEMLRVRKRYAVEGSVRAIGCLGGVFKSIGDGMHAVNFFIQPDLTLRLWDYQKQAIFFPRVDDVVVWAII